MVTDFINNRIFVMFIISIVFMVIYSFIVSDRINYTDTILAFISSLMSFITAFSAYTGVNYIFGGNDGILTYSYQSQSVASLFVIIGLIMMLIGSVKVYDILKDKSDIIKI